MTTPILEAFLLVQKGKLRAWNGAPHALDFDAINEFCDFQIYGGARNEHNEPEILGPIVRVWLRETFTTYHLLITRHNGTSTVTFPADAMPSEVLVDKLRPLFRAGELLDPACLPDIVLVGV